MSLLSQHPVGRGAVFLGRNLSFQFTLGRPCPAPHRNPFHRGPGIRRWPTHARFAPGEAGSERRLRQTST